MFTEPKEDINKSLNEVNKKLEAMRKTIKTRYESAI